MGTRIDTRKITEAEARRKADEHARCELRIIAHKARADARIAELKADLADAIAEDEERMAELAPAVIAWLLAHKPDFCDQRKKTVDTPTAKFGFRKCSNTVIDDPDLVLRWARNNGYTDVYAETEITLSRTAIRKRIAAGEDVPGARLDTDYEPFVKPQKTLVDEAKQANA